MQIVLVRHGRPKFRSGAWMRASELPGWIAAYDAAGIDPAFPPPAGSIAQAGRCRFTVCSHLPRSLESARALGIQKVDLCGALFRELDLPCAPWHTPKLPWLLWVALFRLLSLLGYAENGEPFRAGRRRAELCAERLSALAAEHESVLFVGHGGLNWLIARNLKRAGWSGPALSPLHHWEYGIYRYNAS